MFTALTLNLVVFHINYKQKLSGTTEMDLICYPKPQHLTLDHFVGVLFRLSYDCHLVQSPCIPVLRNDVGPAEGHLHVDGCRL